MKLKTNVIVMYKSSDEHYLNDLLSTIPDEFGVILFETIASSRDFVSLEFSEGNYKKFKIFYTGSFHFGKFRNLCLEHNYSDLVLFLDADERLLINQHKDLINAINQIETLENFGGFMFFNISVYTAVKENNGLFKKEGASQIKLFTSELRYKENVAIHEQLDLQKKNIFETKFLVHHVGYETNPNEILKKIERNERIEYNNNARLVEYKRQENISILTKKLRQTILNNNNTGVLQ